MRSIPSGWGKESLAAAKKFAAFECLQRYTSHKTTSKNIPAKLSHSCERFNLGIVQSPSLIPLGLA